MQNNFFEINRKPTEAEAKEWVEKYVGNALRSIVSLNIGTNSALVIASTERGDMELKISLPYVLE